MIFILWIYICTICNIIMLWIMNHNLKAPTWFFLCSCYLVKCKLKLVLKHPNCLWHNHNDVSSCRLPWFCRNRLACLLRLAPVVPHHFIYCGVVGTRAVVESRQWFGGFMSARMCTVKNLVLENHTAHRTSNQKIYSLFNFQSVRLKRQHLEVMNFMSCLFQQTASVV